MVECHLSEALLPRAVSPTASQSLPAPHARRRGWHPPLPAPARNDLHRGSLPGGPCRWTPAPPGWWSLHRLASWEIQWLSYHEYAHHECQFLFPGLRHCRDAADQVTVPATTCPEDKVLLCPCTPPLLGKMEELSVRMASYKSKSTFGGKCFSVKKQNEVFNG